MELQKRKECNGLCPVCCGMEIDKVLGLTIEEIQKMKNYCVEQRIELK